MSFAEAIASFQQQIDPQKTLIKWLPDHILVFGGKCGDEATGDLSCRDVLIKKADSLRHPLYGSFLTPESFGGDWNAKEGYENLVEFEIDAGCLARAIVLVSEAPGAFAELGAFCMDPVLRERLFVIVGRKHNDRQDSFIVLGPLAYIRKAVEDGDFAPVCVVDNLEDYAGFRDQVKEVLEALQHKIAAENKQQIFDPERRRDQLLLIADFVDIFRAVSMREISEMLARMGIHLSRPELSRRLWLLELFGFIGKTQVWGRVYIVAKRGEEHKYLDYQAAEGQKKFDRVPFKVQISAKLRDDSGRYKAFSEFKGRAL